MEHQHQLSYRYFIAERAEAHGLNLPQLARRARMSRAALRRYWKGEVRRPDLQVMYTLARTLECSISDLIELIGHPHNQHS